jgi:hypothetical protein
MSAQDDVASFSVAHLPIVKKYTQRMGLVEKIDSALNCGMHTSPGKIVLGLIMNILCGRSPIYRLQQGQATDLKQFVLSLLCVEGNPPFHARILDGNSSDKKDQREYHL